MENKAKIYDISNSLHEVINDLFYDAIKMRKPLMLQSLELYNPVQLSENLKNLSYLNYARLQKQMIFILLSNMFYRNYSRKLFVCINMTALSIQQPYFKAKK